jgi:hypothetical protein
MANSKSFIRIRGVLAFCIGIFGALAILGVFFKIMKVGNYELFMKVGFVGEAGAFIVMGVLELMTSWFQSPETDVTDRSRLGHMPMSSNFSAMLDAKLDARLDELLIHLAGDIDHFRNEMSALSAELAHSAGAVRNMRAQLESVASADLAHDAQVLGQGMAQLSTEMAGAGSAVEAMRSDLEFMVHRFRAFNAIQPTAEHQALAHRGRRAS